MKREKMFYWGDGIRAPETNEMVGKTVNFHGKKGKVVENDAFFITVEWEEPRRTSRFLEFLRSFFRRPVRG